eukprot:4679573-Pyramimonas_sp.AAC.1
MGVAPSPARTVALQSRGSLPSARSALTLDSGEALLSRPAALLTACWRLFLVPPSGVEPKKTPCLGPFSRTARNNSRTTRSARVAHWCGRAVGH